MYNPRSPQRGLWDCDHLYGDYVGEDSFYGFLASQRGKIFKDEDFADLYCKDNGRPSKPPSILATALILQTYCNVSDAEAKDRADYDLRWKVALGIELKESPFAKSTLQLFRSQLVLHDKARQMFLRSIEKAKAHGFLKNRKKLHAAIDTMAIIGRGAVKDTYNLLADGITKLIRALATLSDVKPQEWAQEHGLGRYFQSSIKATEDVDWSDDDARKKFLGGIVNDADRLLVIARSIRNNCEPDGEESKQIEEGADLLLQLLAQDIKRTPEGPEIIQGVAKDRICSAHDPEMRHGRKSSKGRFDGSKGVIVTDTTSQLITAVDELPGNAHDSEKALELIEQSEENVGMEVADTGGDCAYGTGEVRREFEEAERKLEAPVPSAPETGKFSKSEFTISRDEASVKCPAGCTTRKYKLTKIKKSNGNTYRVKRFIFPKERCLSCGLRDQCVKGKGARSITLHPQEQLMQKARRHQKTKAFREAKRLRQVVEHRIARLRQLGMRQSRYFGREKTLFQLMMVATVANLTLVAASAAPSGAFLRSIPAFCASIIRGMFKSASNFYYNAVIPKINNFLSAPIILLLLRRQRSAYAYALEKRGFQPGC